MAEEIEVKTVVVGPLAERCYVLSRADAPDCVVIDPGDEAERIRAATGGKAIAAILLTHGHFDHIGAVGALMDEGTRLVVHPLDRELLADPAKNACAMLGREVTAPAPTQTADEGDTVAAAGMRFTVLHTPGHTQGSVCYRLGDKLFTGDTLFDGGYGRTDMYGGDDGQMMASLRRLLPLSKECRIYPGH